MVILWLWKINLFSELIHFENFQNIQFIDTQFFPELHLNWICFQNLYTLKTSIICYLLMHFFFRVAFKITLYFKEYVFMPSKDFGGIMKILEWQMCGVPGLVQFHKHMWHPLGKPGLWRSKQCFPRSAFFHMLIFIDFL